MANGFGQGFDVEAALRLAEEMEKPKRSVTRPPVTGPFDVDKAALAAAVAGTPWAPPPSGYEVDEAALKALEAAVAGTKWGDPVSSPTAPAPAPTAPAPPVPWYDQTTPQSVVDAFISDRDEGTNLALTDQMTPEEAQWLEMAKAQGVFGKGLGQVPFDQTVPTADWDPEMTYGQQLVDDPRLQMRIDLATDLLDQGYTVADIEQFLGMESLMTSEELGTTAGQMVDPSFAGVGSQQWFDYIDQPFQETAAWVDSPEFAKEYGAPAAPEDDGTVVCKEGFHAENGVCVPDQVVQQTDFGGPGEKPAAMTPVGNFVNSQTEALNVIQRRLDEITKATNDARDAGIEQIDIIQSEAQKQLDATFANQYTVLDPMTGEPLKEGEMDRLLATWKDEQSKSKTARAADKAVIGNLALNEGIVASQMEFDTIDTLYGDQIDAQYQYIDSLYRIGKLAKDDRDAMLTNIMAGYKSDLVSKAIEIILGAEIDTADRRAEVREDALAARDVAEYLGAPANTIFGGMRGDIPIGEMAYQTSERIAGQDFARDEAALDRLAQGINPATGRPYGFMTSGPYAGMTIGEANAARQEKDLIDLQMDIMEAEEQRAVDAVDLEAERYEEMWREGGKGWYDLGINPATGRPWDMDDEDDEYDVPMPSGFMVDDFPNRLPGVEVIDGEYWMTPGQFNSWSDTLTQSMQVSESGVPVGGHGDIIVSMNTVAAAGAGGAQAFGKFQEEVNARRQEENWRDVDITTVWKSVIGEQVNTNIYAAMAWANMTGQNVQGESTSNDLNALLPFTATPEGQIIWGDPVTGDAGPGFGGGPPSGSWDNPSFVDPYNIPSPGFYPGR